MRSAARLPADRANYIGPASIGSPYSYYGSNYGSSSHRSLAAMLQTPGTLDFIDLSSPGPGQRPRGALRFRFESATRALRGFGVEADECRTLFRSTSSRGAQTPGGGYDGVRIGVTVTLNCSFF